jgi:hypothetical protein
MGIPLTTEYIQIVQTRFCIKEGLHQPAEQRIGQSLADFTTGVLGLRKSRAFHDFISVAHGVTAPQIAQSFVLFDNPLYAASLNYI